MCLAIPGRIQKVVQVDGSRLAQVSFGGIIKEASLEMVPEARIGDYVLVHVGVALAIVNAAEAEKIFQYLKEADELNDLQL